MPLPILKFSDISFQTRQSFDPLAPLWGMEKMGTAGYMGLESRELNLVLGNRIYISW